MSSLARRVLLTLAYTHQFHYPLTADEVWLRLVQAESNDSPRLVAETLRKLQQQKKVVFEKGYYSVAPTSWHHTRQGRAKLSEQKKAQLAEAVDQLRSIPWIVGVALTGSMAMENITTLETDLDFMIVVQPRRLWLVRLWTTWVTWKAGRRRTWGHNQPASWCFNLWLDTNHLQIPRDKQSLYTAYEVCQARWMLDTGGVQQQFYQANDWVRSWIPHFFNRAKSAVQPRLLDAQKKRLFNPFLALGNVAVFVLQLLYMSPHRTRETIGLGHAYFHPRDTRRLIYGGWRRALLQLLHV